MPPSSKEILPRAPAQHAGESPWDEAFLRVESYLRALRIESRITLNRLTTEIIVEARERVRTSAEEPVTAAMGAAQARIGAWFARAGYPGDWADARVRARGRLALVLAGAPALQNDGLLADDPVPAGLAADLAGAVLQPGPELRFSNMAAAPLEFGFKDPEDRNAPRRGLGRTLRAGAGWLLLTGFFGVAWAASH